MDLAEAIVCIAACVSLAGAQAGASQQSDPPVIEPANAAAGLADETELLAFAGLRAGNKVAHFLPHARSFAQLLCAAVGDQGHVYIVAPPGDAPPADADSACTNLSIIALRSRIYPAPELYSASADPGNVYEYYASRLPIESFLAPEPLDAIFILHTYRDLRGERLGSPNLQWVHRSLLTALKPGGILIVGDRVDAEQVKHDALRAGFEFVAARALGSARVLLGFRRPVQ